jgi:hypothetical protein
LLICLALLSKDFLSGHFKKVEISFRALKRFAHLKQILQRYFRPIKCDQAQYSVLQLFAATGLGAATDCTAALIIDATTLRIKRA